MPCELAQALSMHGRLTPSCQLHPDEGKGEVSGIEYAMLDCSRGLGDGAALRTEAQHVPYLHDQFKWPPSEN
eukprot:scaffold87650_cov20-Tisochrysis_lutea.AAC.2